jgi:hypothetical protein
MATRLNKRRATPNKEVRAEELVTLQQDANDVKSRDNHRRHPDRTATILVVGFSFVALAVFYAGANARRPNSGIESNGIRHGGFMRMKHKNKHKYHHGHHHDDNSYSTDGQGDEQQSQGEADSGRNQSTGSQCKYLKCTCFKLPRNMHPVASREQRGYLEYLPTSTKSDPFRFVSRTPMFLQAAYGWLRRR